MIATELQPGIELDQRFAALVEGYVWDEARCRVCGWPLGEWVLGVCTQKSCSMRPVPSPRADSVAPVSTEDSAALAALERFADSYKAGYSIRRTRPLFEGKSYYDVTLHGGFKGLAYSVSVKTLAHAIVLAMLKAVEGD